MRKLVCNSERKALRDWRRVYTFTQHVYTSYAYDLDKHCRLK